MARILHSVWKQEAAVAADNVEVFNLPVNPLSVVYVVIRPLNDNAGTAINGMADYLALADSINQLRILWRGQSVYNIKGVDLAALNYFRRGINPIEANSNDTDNERRCVVLPVVLGRFPWDAQECLPATKAGELTMELDIDVADTGYDTFRYSIETDELLDASPKVYERVTQISKTFAATGTQDFQLVPGQLNRGLLLFGTTDFTGATPAPSWGRVQLLGDNQQLFYASSDFETSRVIAQMMGRMSPILDRHTHRVDSSSASAVQQSGRPINFGKGGWQNYSYLDLDVNRDDSFSLDTKGVTSLFLRSEVETADAVRVVQIERIAA